MSSRMGHVIDLLSEDGNSPEFFVGGAVDERLRLP